MILMTRLAKKPTTIAINQHKISRRAPRLRGLSLISSPSGPALQAGGERKLHRATVKGKLHSRQGWIRENAGYGVGIDDFQTQIGARRDDFRFA